MFTGIVLEKGQIISIKSQENALSLTIGAKNVLQDLKKGGSIAVNGTCLTAVSLTKTSFTVDVMPETYQATNLKNLKKGQIVNLEPALKMSDRFGGHFVSGHIDDVGQIIGRKREANAVVFEIQCPTALKNYILSKGAIAIDGISLTVVQVTKNTFSVSIIPHTLAETNLDEKNVGDTVNLECDMLVKNVAHLLRQADQLNKLTQGVAIDV